MTTACTCQHTLHLAHHAVLGQLQHRSSRAARSTCHEVATRRCWPHLEPCARELRSQIVPFRRVRPPQRSAELHARAACEVRLTGALPPGHSSLPGWEAGSQTTGRAGSRPCDVLLRTAHLWSARPLQHPGQWRLMDCVVPHQLDSAQVSSLPARCSAAGEPSWPARSLPLERSIRSTPPVARSCVRLPRAADTTAGLGRDSPATLFPAGSCCQCTVRSQAPPPELPGP